MILLELHPRVRANRARINDVCDELVDTVVGCLADGKDRREGLYWLGVARAALLVAALRWDDPA